MLKIEYGLFDSMVVQRDRQGQTDICFGGKCDCVEEGTLMGRLDEQAWIEIGDIKAGTFTGKVSEVKTGGPYSFEIKAVGADKTSSIKDVKNVYVGDVWILAGQSNMQGGGRIDERIDAERPVRCFYQDDTWGHAVDPLHSLTVAVDAVHHQLMKEPVPVGQRQEIDSNRIYGVGCGITFANAMYRKLGIPIGLISCAHAGTTMEQWLPGKSAPGDGLSLYSALLRRVRKNSGHVAGVLWYQGESDTEYGGDVNFYDRMVLLINSLRRDLDCPKLPFIQAQLSRVYNTSSGYKDILWTFIREQQRLLALKVPNVSTVSTLDLELGDPIHLESAGLIRLGKRLAYAAEKYFPESKAGTSDFPTAIPTIAGADFKSGNANLKSGDRDYVEVRIAGVNGCLDSAGKPQGFSIIGEYGWKLEIYKTEINQSANSVYLYYCNDNPRPEKFFLYYGYGKMPNCNITDRKDMGLLGAGPFPLGEKPPYV